MAWKIALDPATERDLDKLDTQINRRVLTLFHPRKL